MEKIKLKRKIIKKENYGYLFIAPFFIAFIIFKLYPIIYSLILSFMRWDGIGEMNFVAFENYKRLITDEFFWQAFKNTSLIWIITVIPQIGFAVVLAYIFNDNYIKGKDTLRAIYYLPNLVTAASIGILFNILLDWQAGPINKFLLNVGIIKEAVNWLSIPGYTRGAVAIIQWWMWFGYSMIICMAGMKAIPRELFEAAYVDGANRWQTFWRITIPNLKNILIYMVITSLIGGLQLFDIPMVLTDGYGAPERSILTMVMYLYNTAFKNNNYGYGAAVAYGLFFIILIFSAFSMKIMMRKNKEDSYEH